MAYKLNQSQIDLINEKLPPQFAALKYSYPVSIYNAASYWDKPKFPQGYVPQNISIYYDESPNSPAIAWRNGRLERVRIEEIPIDPEVILTRVEALWVYIQVRGKIILDKTDGIQFPPELTQHELMLRKLVHAMSSGKYEESQG